MKGCDMKRNCMDPCLFYRWEEGYLLCCLLWVDNFLLVGPDHLVPKVKDRLTQLMECDDVGEMVEYVGCKIERNREIRDMRLTQPVKIEKMKDEFGCDPNMSRPPNTPAEPGSVLRKEGTGENNLELPKPEQKVYRSGTAMLLHVMRWSRVETMNAVRECSRYMQKARQSHMKALKRIMNYIVTTSKRGLYFRPTEWDGKDQNFKFKIKGKSDSEYNKDDSLHSVNGWSTWLFGCCVTNRSKMMPIVAPCLVDVVGPRYGL